MATNVAAQLENKLPANAYTPQPCYDKTDDPFLCILVPKLAPNKVFNTLM